MQRFDAIILGAGAAGLMCALTAGRRGRRVLVLERNQRPGAKILISGGGRCNFTNLLAPPERFISSNPHFSKSALSRFTPNDFIVMVERHHIAYHEKTLGQLFCDGSARQILAMLLDECAAARVDVRTGVAITAIVRGDRFRCETSHGNFDAPALVLATGGLSIPRIGATGFSYMTARQFGLPLIEPRPGLVPLRLAADELALAQSLTGVAIEVEVACARQRFRESMLFTHRGLSGPAILQISSYWREGQSLTIDLAPGHNLEALLQRAKHDRPRAELKTILSEVLPVRAAQALGGVHAARAIANLPDRLLASVAKRIKAWQVMPAGSEGWEKAEVTAGGVAASGLSSKTMEAREVRGLFVIGEAVDVTGWLGGYNFQWAWSSGFAAGQAL
jgi:hypothetical protein